MNKLITIAAAALAACQANAYNLQSKALTPITLSAMPPGEPMKFVENGVPAFSIEGDLTNADVKWGAALIEKCVEKTVGRPPLKESAKFRISFEPDADPTCQKIAMRTTPTGIVLGGNARYAALDFAERVLGVRWYFPGETGTIYPAVTNLTVSPFAYEDEAWFKKRGDKYYVYTSAENKARIDHWRPYMGEISTQDARNFVDYWKDGGVACPGGSHSPTPEAMAKNHPDKLKTIFYTSPSGKFWHNPFAHIGNAWNVVDLSFADLLIDDWKLYYSSNGKIDNGDYRREFSPTTCSFGVCDTYLQRSEFTGNPTVEKLGLINPADDKRGPDAWACNIYARFYQHLGNRLKREMPDKRLFLLIYYQALHAPSDPRFTLPDNVEVNVCAGDLPAKTRNPEAAANAVRIFREWYDALGGRPALKAWLYTDHNDRFARAIIPEFTGDVPKLLGKYLSREGGMFYDFDGGHDIWHYFWSAYGIWRAEWNPDYNPDEAIPEIMRDCLGEKAGAEMAEFHRILKKAYLDSVVQSKGRSGALPVDAIGRLESCVAAAQKAVAPGSDEARRLALITDYWVETFKTHRALAAYEPPVYDVKRRTNNLDWSTVPPMPLLTTTTGAKAKNPAAIRLAWDESGLHGRIDAPYAPKADRAKDLWANDSVELLFLPGLGKEQEYQMAFDCLDRDYLSKQRHLPIVQPADANYRVPGFRHVSKIRGGGWQAEFFVPWNAFDEGAPKVYDQWNANIVSNRRGGVRESNGSAFTMGNNHNRDMFGILRFVGLGD